MSDWGKFLLWMLKTMPWFVCLISALLAFFPASWCPAVYLPVRDEWGGWFAVLFLVSLAFSVLWFSHRCISWRRERQRFDRLPLFVRYLLLDLYFGSDGAAEVLYRNPTVASLCAQGFLVVCNSGMVTAGKNGEMMVMVTLSERSLLYFEAHESEFRQRYESLKKDAQGIWGMR